MNENITILFSDVELDLKKYYQRKLNEKGQILEQKYYANCKMLEDRLSRFITMDFFKNIKSIMINGMYIENFYGTVLLSICLIQPMIPQKAKAKMIEEVLEIAFHGVFWESIIEKQITKEDVIKFEKELVNTMLNYSFLIENKTQKTSKLILSGCFKFLGNKAKQIYKCAMPVDLFNLKRVLGAMYEALGIYIINREFLENSQEDALKEAQYYFKVVMVKRIQNIFEIIFGNDI